jgi:glycosyltransferase involved in cell wall biosynthesis
MAASEADLRGVASPHRTEPIPVLLVVRELDQGGVERDVAKIALHLDRTRFLPHVATYYAHGLRYEELMSAGMPILHLPIRKLASRDTIRLGFRLWRYIRSHGVKIVHSYDSSGVVGLAVAQMAGVPVVIGSQLSYRNILDRNTRTLLRLADRYSDAILVNCEAIRRYMVEDEHVPADKLGLCYNGVDTAEFFPGHRETPDALMSAPLTVGTVCVLRPEKNLTLLQEAFARIKHIRSGLRLVIVGSGPLLATLKENADRLEISESTVFVPATRDVATWLRAMDIFVLPSYSEAFSNSLLEGMACGCAVIGSRVGGTPELVGINEDRGLLFQSSSVEQLTDRLARLISDDEQRRSLGAKAAEFASTHLTVEIAAETTANIYDKLLRSKGGWPIQRTF